MKDNKLFMIIVTILAAIVLVLNIQKVISNNSQTDGIKFKEEYEKLNGKKNDQGKKYREITIDSKNKMVYKTTEEVLDLIEKYPNMYGAIGIHPEDIDGATQEDIKFIEVNLSNEKIVAIGEIGLDYYYTKENKEKQIKLFETQLALAEKYNIPVIVHSRDATEDTINSLKKFKCKGVIHSFSGSLETAKIYIKMGYLLGVNGVITFKNSKIKEVIKEVGLENVVLETDSPYLAPVPYRGKINSSKNIPVIAEFLAKELEQNVNGIEKITEENTKSLFTRLK